MLNCTDVLSEISPGHVSHWCGVIISFLKRLGGPSKTNKMTMSWVPTHRK